MHEEGLDIYPQIVKLFDSNSEAIKLIKQVLLNDRVLRLVFMQVLPDEKTGKMEICNKKLAAEKIKGDKTLADYIKENNGIFLCGKPKVANEILTRGGKIIVAVTDRHYDKVQYSVANLRQCYIPLPDRRLLAFKSSGLFHDPVSQPYNKNSTKFTGVGGKTEKDNALTSFEKLGPCSEGFIDFLAYQPLYSLPDGKGNFDEAEYGNDGKKVLPYLIVNCAISPHRLSKISQLDDPELSTLRKTISPLLRDLATKRQRSGRNLMPVLERFYNSGQEVIPLEDYLLYITEEIGIGTARKQNNELFHVTFHEQDVNMGGQMCDREELYTFEKYFKKNEIKYVDPFFAIIKETHIGIRDLISAVGVIKFLYKSKKEWEGNRIELLKSFFRAYFRRLSYVYFERWESLIDYLGNVIIFYFDRNEELGQSGLKKIRAWYRQEKETRRPCF
ncbi:MAG: hypothetical protein ACR2PH_02930 [Desulfobulbia bacterium]